MFCFVLLPVWSWLVLTTTSSECSTVIRSVTWLWRRPGRTASLGRSWNRGRCVWAESVAKMKSVWTAWTLARKFSTLPGILLRTSSLWQPPITFTYSKIRSTSTTVPPPHVPEKRGKRNKMLQLSRRLQGVFCDEKQEVTYDVWTDAGHVQGCCQTFTNKKHPALHNHSSSIKYLHLPFRELVYLSYLFISLLEGNAWLFKSGQMCIFTVMIWRIFNKAKRQTFADILASEANGCLYKKTTTTMDFHSLWNTMPSNFLRNVWLIRNID